MMEEKKPHWAKTWAVMIGAVIVGRYLGLLGFGAILLGYFVYTKMLETKGRAIAVMMGIGVGVVAYMLVIFLITASKLP